MANTLEPKGNGSWSQVWIFWLVVVMLPGRKWAPNPMYSSMRNVGTHLSPGQSGKKAVRPTDDSGGLGG